MVISMASTVKCIEHEQVSTEHFAGEALGTGRVIRKRSIQSSEIEECNGEPIIGIRSY